MGPYTSQEREIIVTAYLTRRRCTQLGSSRRSLQRSLVKDLKIFPYKVQAVHELLSTDSRAVGSNIQCNILLRFKWLC